MLNCWFFFTFFLHLPHRQFSFRREVLNHHTPPPIPKLSSITKTRILFVFLPKKVPVFCPYFYKNEPVWRIGHTALPDFSLNPSIRQLLFDVEDGSFAASHKSSRRLLEFSHQFSGEIPAVPAAVSAAYHTIVATFKCRSVRSCEVGPLAPGLMHSWPIYGFGSLFHYRPEFWHMVKQFQYFNFGIKG